VRIAPLDDYEELKQMVFIGVILIFVGVGLLITGWLSSEPPLSWAGYPGIALALFGGYLLKLAGVDLGAG